MGAAGGAAPPEAQAPCASLAAEDGALLGKIEKVRVLRNDRREGKAASCHAKTAGTVSHGLGHSLRGGSPGARARPESWTRLVRKPARDVTWRFHFCA